MSRQYGMSETFFSLDAWECLALGDRSKGSPRSAQSAQCLMCPSPSTGRSVGRVVTWPAFSFLFRGPDVLRPARGLVTTADGNH